MGRWLSDYEVEAHLCIPDGSQLLYSHPQGLFKLHLRNLRTETGTDTPLLSAQLILEAEDEDAAASRSRDLLRFFLDTLAFVTSNRFAIHQIVRVVDWTQGVSRRQCVQFKGFPGADLPIPALDATLLKTVRALDNAEISPRLRRALRWFAQGVGSTYFDDQFQYFWFVLELVAELTKDPSRVPDLCPKCRTAVFCSACSTTPTHRPFPKQAIQQLVERTLLDKPDEAFTKFLDVRNQLLHGEEVRDVEKSLSISMAEVVDQIGRVAWMALLYAFQATIDGTKDFLRVDSYTHKVLTTKVHMIVGAGADPNNPRVDDLPSLQISLITRDVPREKEKGDTYNY